MRMADSDDRQPEVLDCAIVGGGVAGCYSAYRLRHNKQRIGLFEGSGRIGGRLLTYHLPCCPSLHLELGGMRYAPRLHRRLDRLVRSLGFQAVPFPKAEGTNGDQTTLFYVRGRRLTEADVRHGEVPYALTREEKANQHRLVAFYFEKLLGIQRLDPSTPHEKFASLSLLTTDGTPLHMLTFGAALDRVASPDGKAFLVDTGKFPAKIFTTSMTAAHAGFQHCLTFDDSTNFLCIERGMTSLPQRLAHEFQESSRTHKTLLNHKLISIDRTPQGLYSLKFQCLEDHGHDTSLNRKTHFRRILAKRAILALPITALDSIQWTPLQQSVFRKARALVNEIVLCKIFLVFSIPWWEELGQGSSAATTYSDQSYRLSFEYGRGDGCFVLLASYSECKLTNLFRVLQGQGEAIVGSAPGDLRVSVALKDVVLGQLSETYGVRRQEIPEPIGGVAKFWDVCLANWKSGCLSQGVLDAISRPTREDDVFLVGSDAALGTSFHTWIEGALGSVDDTLTKYQLVRQQPQTQCKL